MRNNKKQLDQGNIEELLELLGERLTLETPETNWNLVLCGGAALNVLNLVTRTTKDIDVIGKLENKNIKYANFDLKFKYQVNEHLKDLWDVWLSFGVYSEGSVTAISPEEAVTGLCIFGRFDQRLFDEALSFLIQNSRFLSKNRLFSLIEKVDEDSKRVFHIIAIILAEYANDKRFILASMEYNYFKTESFFISLDGNAAFSGKKDDPIFLKSGFTRNIFIKSEKLRSLPFVAENNPWIKAKLVFGNTVRADTIMELINNDLCTAPGIAYNTGHTQKSIWNILTDFELAGLVERKKSLNKIIYILTEKGRKHFKEFAIKKKPPKISEWIKTGYYLAAFSKLPENASALLIKSEEKKTEQVISLLSLDRIGY